MRCHFKSDYEDWTRFQVKVKIQSSASPRTWSNCADLKSSPVLIVGFEILHIKSQFLSFTKNPTVTLGSLTDSSSRLYKNDIYHITFTLATVNNCALAYTKYKCHTEKYTCSFFCYINLFYDTFLPTRLSFSRFLSLLSPNFQSLNKNIYRRHPTASVPGSFDIL
jgi:hypothetical protein